MLNAYSSVCVPAWLVRVLRPDSEEELLLLAWYDSVRQTLTLDKLTSCNQVVTTELEYTYLTPHPVVVDPDSSKLVEVTGNPFKHDIKQAATAAQGAAKKEGNVNDTTAGLEYSESRLDQRLLKQRARHVLR